MTQAKANMTAGEVRLLDSMRRLCSRREYCSEELRAKLRAKGGTDCSEAILETLVSEGFLSDLRYACAFARDKSALDGWGAKKIEYALRAKKIDGELIGQAIGEIDAGLAEAKLKKMTDSYIKTHKNKPGLRNRLFRFALSRGYSSEQLKSVLDILGEEVPPSCLE